MTSGSSVAAVSDRRKYCPNVGETSARGRRLEAPGLQTHPGNFKFQHPNSKETPNYKIQKSTDSAAWESCFASFIRHSSLVIRHLQARATAQT
jgi:hypothetical protein